MKAKRKAVGYMCLGIFHSLNAVTAQITHLTFPDPQSPSHVLTDKEHAYLQKRKTEVHEIAQRFRRLGHHFLR